MVEINLIFRLFALAIVTTIAYTFIKQTGHDEYAFLTILAGLAIGLVWVLPVIVELFNTVSSVFGLYY